MEYYFFAGSFRPEARLLDIARRGPDVASFEDFVGKLRRQIRAASKPREKAK